MSKTVLIQPASFILSATTRNTRTIKSLKTRETVVLIPLPANNQRTAA